MTFMLLWPKGIQNKYHTPIADVSEKLSIWAGSVVLFVYFSSAFFFLKKKRSGFTCKFTYNLKNTILLK